MRSLSLGVLASLLSAATALIITSTGSDAVSPLWLLLGQYLVGIVLAPPRRKPVAPLSLHALRLVAGLWAFGAYYVALGVPGASASQASMILNTAPIFATFYAVTQPRARFSALLAFAGVALSLVAQGKGFHFSQWQLLALSAAVAYAASFILLGMLSAKGESAGTTNSLYNLSSGVVIILLLVIIHPPLPVHWWPVFAVGGIAAVRIQVLTMAATTPEESARVSVLTNLAFLWLALAELLQGRSYSLGEWAALALVMLGVGLSPRSRPVPVTAVTQSRAE